MNISSPWLRSYLNGEISEPLVISTTGSGGEVKKVEIPALALIASAKAAHKYLGATAGNTWSLLLPTNHIAGINVLARSILLNTEIKAADESADFTSIVPTQLHKALTEDAILLKHLQSCKAVLVGGARLSESLLASASAVGINVVTTYGSTETCGGCVYNGTPLDGVEIQIVDGLIEIKAPEMNSGEWIKTNDLGEIKDGKLLVNGRADDVIISGGENISLQRLEKFLENKFPGQNFLALGLSDEKWGQALALISDLKFPESLNEEINSELGKIYIPKHTRVVGEIPTIGIGKYDRIAAKKLFLSNE
jgi:O-succinylbenzoic acid--CoA ligase